MENLKNVIERWGYCAFLVIVAVALCFALGATIYTAVTNPFVGIVGLAGVLCALGVLATAIVKEIKGL